MVEKHSVEIFNKRDQTLNNKNNPDVIKEHLIHYSAVIAIQFGACRQSGTGKL
jgi:hypothetical protein